MAIPDASVRPVSGGAREAALTPSVPSPEDPCARRSAFPRSPCSCPSPSPWPRAAVVAMTTTARPARPPRPPRRRPPRASRRRARPSQAARRRRPRTTAETAATAEATGDGGDGGGTATSERRHGQRRRDDVGPRGDRPERAQRCRPDRTAAPTSSRRPRAASGARTTRRRPRGLADGAPGHGAARHVVRRHPHLARSRGRRRRDRLVRRAGARRLLRRPHLPPRRARLRAAGRRPGGQRRRRPRLRGHAGPAGELRLRQGRRGDGQAAVGSGRDGGLAVLHRRLARRAPPRWASPASRRCTRWSGTCSTRSRCRR